MKSKGKPADWICIQSAIEDPLSMSDMGISQN